MMLHNLTTCLLVFIIIFFFRYLFIKTRTFYFSRTNKYHPTCRSELNRLNFQGFYTVLLERNDELISVATVRYLVRADSDLGTFIFTSVKSILKCYLLLTPGFMGKKWQKSRLLLHDFNIVDLGCVVFWWMSLRRYVNLNYCWRSVLVFSVFSSYHMALQII